MKTFAVILAAGSGKRFLKHSGDSKKKQFIEIGGLPLWVKAAKPFASQSFIDGLVIVCAKVDQVCIEADIKRFDLNKVLTVIEGGIDRQGSVYRALQWLEHKYRTCAYVFIHDGVRPYVTSELIEKLWNERKREAVIAGIALSDTIKEISNNIVQKTVDRRLLIRAQTPQLFSYALLKEGYEKLRQDKALVTDDASVIERMGRDVTVVSGDPKNIKVTTPDDLPNDLSDTRGPSVSVGIGIDTHAFTDGDFITLGGIDIPYTQSLKGHSDADVLTHAICDAVLGAAGLPDIGHFFPDSDPQYKNISSLKLLAQVIAKITEKRFCVKHIDSTVIAEAPKVSAIIPEMKIRLSKYLKLAPEFIGIKATTMEGLGYVGRKEGISVQAIATLEKQIERKI